MSSDWQEIKFSELCRITRGASPRPIKEFVQETGMPWVKIADATATKGRTIKSTNEFIKEEGVTKSVEVYPGDLILTNSATPGLPMFIGINACIHDGWMLLRNFKGLNKNFAYWLLLHERRNLVMQGNGSVFTNLKTDILKNHIVKIPSLEEQKEIAHRLDLIAEKIELNQQTNETLEAMAQGIFKSWFVDFDPARAKIEATSAGRNPNRAAMATIAGISLDQDWDEAESALDQKLSNMTEEQRQHLTRTAQLFPDELVESEIGEVPKGWGVKPFYDTIEIIGGGTPKTKIDEYWGGEILWYSVVDAPSDSDVFVIDTEKKITETGLENSSAKLVGAGTTIISARGTVGKLALTPKSMTYNQSCYGLRSKNDSPYFNFYKTKQLVESLKRGSHGSVFDTITQKTFKTIDIAQPPENLELRFDNAVEGILSMIQKNLEENTTLTQLRDALLPQLISGELELN